jgi:spore coat protein CotF
MQERDIFLDVLAGTKHSINCYTTAIMESSNQQLRSTWQTLRNEAEQAQYQIYQMAEQKGYYMPAPQAHQDDVQKVKTTLSSAVNNNMGMKNTPSMTSNDNNHQMNNVNPMH